MKTKYKTWMALAGVGAAAFLPLDAKANTLSFSSTGLSGPQATETLFFQNGSFSFGNVGGTSTANTLNLSSGESGYMLGSWVINTPTILFSAGGVTLESATIGPQVGQLVIPDGHGHNLTADLTWTSGFVTTATSLGNATTSGGISGTFNLTSIAYTGTDSTLLDLRNAHQASESVSFTFNGVKPIYLTTLEGTTKVMQDSFAGAISTVPEAGSTISLLGLVLVGVEGLRRRLARR